MQTRANKNRDSQSNAVADRSAVSKHAGNTAVMLADNRPESLQLIKLQLMADNSPQAANAARLQAMADGSPYSMAQRMRMQGSSGVPVQTQDALKEQELNIKADPDSIQLDGPVEKEELQRKIQPAPLDEPTSGELLDGVQAKLMVGPADDPNEREADRVAKLVVGMTPSRPLPAQRQGMHGVRQGGGIAGHKPNVSLPRASDARVADHVAILQKPIPVFQREANIIGLDLLSRGPDYTEENIFKVYEGSEINDSNEYVFAAVSKLKDGKTQYKGQLVAPGATFKPKKGWDFDFFIRKNGTARKFGSIFGYETAMDAETAKGKDGIAPELRKLAIEAFKGKDKEIKKDNDGKSLEHEANEIGRIPSQLKRSHQSGMLNPDQAMPTSALAAPVQLAKLNLRNNQTISGVSNFPSRPSSNLSNQGQHLTAYVVFEDMIRNRVTDRTVTQAAAELRQVLTEIANLPGMQSNSANYLKKAIPIADDDLTNFSSDAKTVGDVIDYILKIRNQVPGTTQQGSGGGHGESSPSGKLRVLEAALRTGKWNKSWNPNDVSNQAMEAVWQLFDDDPPNPQTTNAEDKIVFRILTHFRSIISAYPKTDAWLNSRSDSFAAYLLNNRKGKGMPLQRVGDQELTAIFKTVLSKI